MRRFARSVAAAPACSIALLLLLSPASAAPMVRQSGALDPEWNGWIAQGPGNGASAGPAFDDLGYDSWYIADQSTGNGSTLSYHHEVELADIALAHQLGWILRAEVHLPLYPDAVAGSTVFEFADGERAYRVALGSDDHGDPLIELVGGSATLVAGAPVAIPDPNVTAYHSYELRYNPATDHANLWVDGHLFATGYEGYASSDRQVLFGSTSNADTGTGVWHVVEWEVVPIPEPSSIALALVAGGALVVGPARRRLARRRA